jgi:hypothetical protein
MSEKGKKRYSPEQIVCELRDAGGSRGASDPSGIHAGTQGRPAARRGREAIDDEAERGRAATR